MLEVKQTKYRKIGLQSVQELPLLAVRGHFIHTWRAKHTGKHTGWLVTVYRVFNNHGPVWYPRLMEAFVSIQLEKMSLREEMLNLFYEEETGCGVSDKSEL